MNLIVRFLRWLGVTPGPDPVSSMPDPFAAWRDARIDQLELAHHIAQNAPRGEKPRAARIRRAMCQMVTWGEQPSPGRIQRFLGEKVTHDLNGRDSRTYAETMMALGYVRIPRRPGSPYFRWVHSVLDVEPG